MVYLDIILKSLSILSLLTFMIIFIWGFIVFNGIYSQMRYTNYLLEKISHIMNIQERNHRLNDKLTPVEDEPFSHDSFKPEASKVETVNTENEEK